MKYLLLSLFMSILPERAVGLPLDELTTSYRAKRVGIDEIRSQEIEVLDRGYLGALNKIQQSYQKKGELESALLVKKESELVAAGNWPLPSLPEELGRASAEARATYLKAYLAIERKWAVATTATVDTMVEFLEAEKIKLTKEGKLKEARELVNTMNEMAADSVIIKARELPKRVDRRGSAQAAYILRRPGDDIEVLVNYDDEGKISMKSPVENVVETTGGTKDKGETPARTLGEFVGAKGFQSYPYSAFDQSADGGLIEFDEGHGVDCTKTVLIGDRKALEVQILSTANNAYLTINGVLAPLSQAATFRVTVEYYLPADNKRVKGFFFRQGGSTGSNIGTALVGSPGKWHKEIREAAAGSEFDIFRIHLSGVDFADFAASRGDRFYLHSLKIEYTTFAALIVKEFGEGGSLVAEHKEVASQKPLITNGTLVPR